MDNILSVCLRSQHKNWYPYSIRTSSSDRCMKFSLRLILQNSTLFFVIAQKKCTAIPAWHICTCDWLFGRFSKKTYNWIWLSWGTQVWEDEQVFHDFTESTRTKTIQVHFLSFSFNLLAPFQKISSYWHTIFRFRWKLCQIIKHAKKNNKLQNWTWLVFSLASSTESKN